AADALPAALPPAAADGVTITTYLPEQVQIATASPAAGILVLSDMAFPGWQAQVDGASAPILTVDHALRGVYLSAGTHNVMYSYGPNSFKWGVVISGLALILLIALAAWPRLRRPAPES